MKYLKTKNTYKASNLEFRADDCSAWSYDWWQFVKQLDNGTVVFNNYPYSTSTRAHQRKVRQLMDNLGIHIDVIVRAPCGLQNSDWKGQAKASIEREINTLRDKINAPRSRDEKNIERLKQIKILEAQLLSTLQLIREGA